MYSPDLNPQLEETTLELLKDVQYRRFFVHHLLANLDAHGQAVLKESFRQIATSKTASTNKSLSNEASAERQALEFATLVNYFNFRKQLLAGAIPVSRAAELLGVSRQTVHDRIKNGQLLGLLDNNIVKLPSWQFDAAGPNGALPGLSEVIQALSCGILSKLAWLSASNPIFEGRTPIQVLKTGRVQEVVHEARAVEVI